MRDDEAALAALKKHKIYILLPNKRIKSGFSSLKYQGIQRLFP